jgi:hypothetical protein
MPVFNLKGFIPFTAKRQKGLLTAKLFNYRIAYAGA